MTYTSDYAPQSSLSSILYRNVNPRLLIGLLAILVGLLHVISVFWLLQPTPTLKDTKPLKLVEVLLTPPPKPKITPELPKPKPKTEVKPKPKLVTPVTPSPPKKLPPHLAKGKPLVKEKTPTVVKPPIVEKQAPVHKTSVQSKMPSTAHKAPPVIHKAMPQAKPQPSIRKAVDMPKMPPVLTSKSPAHTATPPATFTRAYKTPSLSAPTPFTSSSSAARTVISKPPPKTGSGGQDNSNVSSGVLELSQAKPSYPMRAKSRNIEGWVKIEFTVTASGTVTNAHVVGASPPGIFDSAALEAIQKFRFKPKMLNGKAVNGMATKKFNFNLH